MGHVSTSLIVCAALLSTGCKSANIVPDERPARIVNPTAESRAELQRVVSDMLFGASVRLSKDALTDSSTLIIERDKIRTIENLPLSGRVRGRPEHFQLVTTGTDCVLIHGKDKARYLLTETECAAE